MSLRYVKLGEIDLFDALTAPIVITGGEYTVKQDGATSLETGAREDVPKGTVAKFEVTFWDEQDASEFRAYCEANRKEADLKLFTRTEDWYYRVWGISISPGKVPEGPRGFLMRRYNVTCYLYSPYSEAATAQTFASAFEKIRVTPNGTLYALDGDGIVHTYSSGWAPLAGEQPAAFITITANDTSLWGLTAAGSAYSYSAGTWTIGLGSASGLLDISIASDGTIFALNAAPSLVMWDDPDLVVLGGACIGVAAESATACYVIGADENVWLNDGTENGFNQITTSGNALRISVASDGTLGAVSTSTGDAMVLSGSAWASLEKSDMISVSPRASDEIWFLDSDGAVWKYTTEWEQMYGSALLDNSDGHIASAPDIEVTCSYNSGSAADVTVAIEDSESLVIAEQALSSELWELIGNENKLLQTYEDAIESGTQWGRDWTGDGAFDTDHMELDDEESAYILLSGPHPARYPVKMTADLSLDAGGADGLATVDISPDGVAWETALDQDDFESGSAEYVLQGTEYMADIYVRLSCASGTSGKKVNVGSIKFEVERWVEYGAMPSVPAGAAKVLTVSATGGSIAVDGTFSPRQLFD